MNILIIFHTPVNAGYAMKALEKTFYDIAIDMSGTNGNVHFAFNEYSDEIPDSLPATFSNILEINRH